MSSSLVRKTIVFVQKQMFQIILPYVLAFSISFVSFLWKYAGVPKLKAQATTCELLYHPSKSECQLIRSSLSYRRLTTSENFRLFRLLIFRESITVIL